MTIAEIGAPPAQIRVAILDDHWMIRQGLESWIAGHADGVVSLWDGATGRQLFTTRLHGRIVHATVVAGRLHAASDLGDAYAVDLRALALPTCVLLGEVWRSVPVVWEGDSFVRRAPPPAHRCAR